MSHRRSPALDYALADRRSGSGASFVWTAVVAAAAAPILFILSSILWHTPYPLSEGVALLEDVADPASFRFLEPTTAYYRPLFYLSLFTAWHAAPSLDAFLATVKLFHIVPVTALAVLFIVHLRPARPADAAAALVALAVLVGSPGFLDNLEIPLTYTIVGMPCALAVWIVLERQARWWHGPAIVALTVLAVGFKEQGLVLVPVVVVAWAMGAPGVRRGTVAGLVAIAAGYVALRLGKGAHWAPFEQDVGLGFTLLSAREAGDRFGSFPALIYAYNGMSTIGNVLFAEPTSGIFRITHAVVLGKAAPWQLLYVASSIGTTALIAWWGIRAFRQSIGRGWTPEARVVGALVAALAASAALSFNYSRDRLGGMALVFYALASFWSLRAAIDRLRDAPGVARMAAALGLVLLAGAWQVRAVHTLEYSRLQSARTQGEWLADVPERREEFARRPVYLRIMEDLIPQGTAAGIARRSNYPECVLRILGPF